MFIIVTIVITQHNHCMHNVHCGNISDSQPHARQTAARWIFLFSADTLVINIIFAARVSAGSKYAFRQQIPKCVATVWKIVFLFSHLFFLTFTLLTLLNSKII